ncbi:uncharacterized protein LOC134283966 [Aedes albopictus]|uniref:Uncharacterized protein n=1 Tax=Aedes albopictus TaxID=7160 RepID=A0ABM1ZUW2_AEDAL
MWLAGNYGCYDALDDDGDVCDLGLISGRRPLPSHGNTSSLAAMTSSAAGNASTSIGRTTTSSTTTTSTVSVCSSVVTRQHTNKADSRAASASTTTTTNAATTNTTTATNSANSSATAAAQGRKAIENEMGAFYSAFCVSYDEDEDYESNIDILETQLDDCMLNECGGSDDDDDEDDSDSDGEVRTLRISWRERYLRKRRNKKRRK